MWFYKEIQRQIAQYRSGEIEVDKTPEKEWIPPARPENLRYGKYTPLANYFSQGSVIDTLRNALFQVQRDRDWWYMPLSVFNGDFLNDGYRRKVELVENRPELRYCFWKAPEGFAGKKERLVVMLSGIGGTFNNTTILALSEQFNNAGFNVLTLDSTFNWRFIVADGKCRLPGYLPDDAARLQKAIAAVLTDLKEREWVKNPEIILCGYSMGGIQTLKLAELEERKKILGVSRFIAVNPPVSLETAMSSIDRMAASSAGWSKSKMREKLIAVAGNLFLKTLDVYPHLKDDAAVKDHRKFIMPVDRESAQVVAGIFLKISMREMLLAAHREEPLPGLPEYKWGSRSELYQALDKLSFRDYAEKILAPRYPGKKVDELLADSHLKSIEKTLQKSDKIRVFHNIDDFLVSESERVWLDSVLKDRITWFSNGGHLGNFYYRKVLDAIVNAAN